MNRCLPVTAALILFASTFVPAYAESSALIPPPNRPVSELSREAYSRPKTGATAERQAALRAWKWSIVPLLASQALDTSSSYGMLELNPLLAGSSGRFGAKATGIKFGATAAILGIEYLVARNHPKAARMIAKLNWTGAVVTTGFAVHNYSIR